MSSLTSDSPLPSPPIAAPRFLSKGTGLALAVLEPLSVAVLFVYLLCQSWQRWSDPLIDFPRDLYFAWRISEGDLLYQQLANWYGPLANLVEGAGFKIFGVGLNTLVGMNIALTIGALLLVRGIFGTLGNRLTVWLSSVVFLGIFAFGHYGAMGNYNFITPYVAQSTYTFLGLLLVLWGLVKHLKSEKPVWLVVAGVGLAVAYLDKPEGLLASAGALAIYFLARTVQAARQKASGWQWLGPALGWLTGGFFSLWLPVFAYLFYRGGLDYAVHASNFTVIAFTDSAVRDTVTKSLFMRVASGLDKPWANFVFELKEGSRFALFCGVMVLAAGAWPSRKKYSLGWWLLPSVALAAAVGCAWFSRPGENIGAQLAFPVCLAAVGCSLWCLWLAWRGGTDFSRWLGAALMGVAASLMMARMILLVRVVHYGFFMMPLALLFWIHLLTMVAAKPAADRRRWLLPALVAALVLACTASLVRTYVEHYRMKTYAVGTGRDRLYSLPPEVFDTGECLNTMLAAFKEKTPSARTLVAFPEGIAANYHLRVRSPLKTLEFNPIALGFTGPPNVVAQLQAEPPGAIFLFYRSYVEYGTPNFGVEEVTGRGIAQWVADRYAGVYAIGPVADSITGYAIVLFAPKDAPPPSAASAVPGAK